MFKSIMHVSFYTDQMDVMRDFYENKLGLKPKIITRFRAYKDQPDHAFGKLAQTRPNDICIVYLEIAPGQFVELFPKFEGQGPHPKWNQNLGYSHFALLVDDIFKTREELEAREISCTPITKGPSETYQFWISDPDGNMFEIMQYTEKSYQVVGHIMEEQP